MRFEGKSEQDAIETALKELKRPASELRYHVVRDEKSFWGGRVVEIEVEVEGAGVPLAPRDDPEAPAAREQEARAAIAAPEPERVERTDARPAGPASAVPRGPAQGRASAEPGAMDDEAFTAVEATLTELLGAAGLLVETRRRPGAEMLFELIGDDVEPLLANRGEGLNGLEVLTGRIASKRIGRPVYPRLDAEGFRAHQKESLEELALRSANEAKRTHSPQLLPPLSPGERRLVHLALAQDPEVETESEGDGFLKRVAVRPRA
ncbi:MAG: Jag N-terminal domain-containing protein [Acidobacteriota bacterium]|nr:Jag N-terminal domain-containing protein [Acidobacteriota bacterium]